MATALTSSPTVLRFTIPGTPIGKGRPRFARLKNGASVAFTPAKTRTYEGIVRSAALDAMQGAGPFTGPVEVTLYAFFPIPQSWPEWKRKLADGCAIVPTTRPDIDNIIKTKDALNGVCWLDDSQVVSVTASKRYHPQPCLQVCIVPLDRISAQVKKRPETTGEAE